MMDSCTSSGTRSFASEAIESKGIERAHFLETAGLTLSSLGMGTYLGELDSRTDRLVEDALTVSIKSGAVNVIDTAINYRYQKAERSVGRALKSLVSAGLGIERGQVFVSTKNGYLAPDADYPHGPESYVQEELIGKGVIRPEDIIAGSHCMTEKYLLHELDRSLANLELNCIDLLYLHNAAESQIPMLGKREFIRRLRGAFSFFERARKEEKIMFYGMATWDCFRNSETEKSHLELEEVIGLAREVGGSRNGFRFIQFPFNLAMPEALGSKTQKVEGKEVSLLEACVKLGIGAFTSVPLMQGSLVGHRSLPEIGTLTTAQVNLQFARSAPGVVAPLIGQKLPTHVSENITLAKVPPLTSDQFRRYFLT
jgi:aryl-alcohol dehydrogenase-like predicted oxidoreductase